MSHNSYQTPLDYAFAESIGQNTPRNYINRAQPVVANVRGLRLQETGTYNEQWLRPFTLANNFGDAASRLSERILQSPNRNKFSAHDISDVIPDVIAPSSDVQSQAAIVGGWNHQRMRFILDLQIEYATGGTVIYTVQGYTDYTGVSAATASIDPKMVFYINSVHGTRVQTQQTMYGTRNVGMTVDSLQVHAADFGMQQPYHLMRPSDVFFTNMNDNIPAHLELSRHGIFDCRTRLTSKPMMSNRENLVPTTYMTRLIKASMMGAQSNVDALMASERLEKSANAVREVDSWDEMFMKLIMSVRTDDTNISRSFTYSELCAIDPNVGNVTQYFPISAGQIQPHYAGQTAEWHGSTAAHVGASILAQSIPSLMTAFSLRTIKFSSTNSVLGGQPATTVVHATSVLGPDADLRTACDQFIHRFELEVLPSISQRNMLGYNIHCSVDLAGETMVQISVGDNILYDFVAPSFSDALFAPTVTSGQHHLTNLSQDLGMILDQIQDNIVHNADYAPRIQVGMPMPMPQAVPTIGRMTAF